jgi:hypothetical protein
MPPPGRRLAHNNLRLGAVCLPADLPQSQSLITTDGQSGSLSWCQALFGAQDQDFVTVKQMRFCWCGCRFWWEDGSVFYSYCWSSPAHSFSGPSPAGIMTIFYCPSCRFGLSGWPRYVTSGRTQQKTPLPIVPVVLPSCICYGGHVIRLPWKRVYRATA